MQKSATQARTRRSRIGGFSMVELSASLALLLILTAIAIPSLMRSLRTYQLNDAATRVTDMLKFSRFEAVRRNKKVCFLMQQSGSMWIAGTDSNCSGTLDANGRQQVITAFATLLPAGTGRPPSPATITGLGASTTLTPLSSASNSVAFDARGAVSPLAAYVLYLGSAANPEFGYRAVILLASGTTQIWTAPADGSWQRIG